MALIAPEDVARRVISTWEDDYSDSLTTVKNSRDNTELVELEDFIDRQISAGPEILPKTWQSPLMQVGIGSLAETDAQGSQQYHNFYDLDVQIYYFLKHPDNRTLALQIMRHQEATLDILFRNPTLGYGGRDRVAPGTLELTPSTAAPLGQNVLVKGLLVRFSFRLFQRGF